MVYGCAVTQLILKYPCADLNGVNAVPLLPLIDAVVPLIDTDPIANGVINGKLLTVVLV